MVILVTGTAGFIGFHLALRLLDDGHTVLGVDNLNDYYCVELKKKRHEILKEYESFTPFEIDLCDLPSMDEVLKRHSASIICHLAAQPGVRYSLVNPFAYQKSNLEGFLNILELCRRYKLERLVYASSSSVYAGVKELPFVENQRLDTPISLYAATKRSNELMAHTYSHLFELNTVGLRFFTVYGPWGRPDMAMWIFTEAILADKPIKVFNNGQMKRDFTFIEDIIAGVKASLFKEDLPLFSIFNLGNNRSENLLYMIDVLEKALGKTVVKQMAPMQPGDVPETYADITLAEDKLGFRPSTPIEVGIPRFVEWYLANNEIAEAVKRSRNVRY